MGSSPLSLNHFQLAPAAWRDLDSIWHYIAGDSVRHADLVEQAIFATCHAAARNPELGHRRVDIRNHEMQFLVIAGYERYSIAYIAGSKPLRIVLVVHGARDVPRLFR